MPIYEFTCQTCGLRFDRLSKMSESGLREVPCAECKQPAIRAISIVNHTFAHGANQVRGAAPPNTGTSDDWNYDKAIGRDAEQKWRLIDARTKHKKDILKATPGATGDDLSRTHDGTYRVMPQGERVAAETGRAVGIAAIQAPKVKG